MSVQSDQGQRTAVPKDVEQLLVIAWWCPCSLDLQWHATCQAALWRQHAVVRYCPLVPSVLWIMQRMPSGGSFVLDSIARVEVNY